MPKIKNIDLEITPGNSASEVKVSYSIEFDADEAGNNFEETILLFSHDRNILNYIGKIIGYLAKDEPIQAEAGTIHRSYSTYFSNADLNEDPSYKDDYYADIFVAPVAKSGSGRSNVIERKF
ncbi:hypothetical protein [Sanyastnella coralliicola]|uniref:hypothetical protein n=1 Tax=Sanyastnella coralliicola TaxID=3069118 RepID=UPI0027B995FB|nr:hypothetical protein [Longitalea sp. SCSIO 12813]